MIDIKEGDLVLYSITPQSPNTPRLKSICTITNINFIGGVLALEELNLGELTLSDESNEPVSIGKFNIKRNFGKISIHEFLIKYPEYEV